VRWPQRYFAEIAAFTGDVGARSLVDRHAGHVCFLVIDDPAILVDVGALAALAELRGHDEAWAVAGQRCVPVKCFSTMYFECTTIGSTSSKSVAPPT